MSKSTNDRKAAIKYADKWFSLFIRKRDYICVNLGCINKADDCSHLFRRHHYATRWDVRNAYGQCRKHHFLHHNESEIPLYRAVVRRHGQAMIDFLEQDSKRITKFTATQIKALGDDLRALYESL